MSRKSKIPVLAGVAAAALVIGAGGASLSQSDGHREVVEASKANVPTGPWPEGDELGNANAIGPGTWQRCAYHLTREGANAYEISHLRTNTMPMSPFGGDPLNYVFREPSFIPGTRHVFTGEYLEGEIETAAQGTQIDALGHFAHLDEPWDGEGEPPFDQARFYGGHTAEEVKPTPGSPLLKLGIEKAPPIVTSAVLLDARAHLGGGEPMEPGQTVTADDIETMLEQQGLGWRGLLPGDVLYIYTGWSEHWQDPADDTPYYFMGPGLSYDAAKHIGDKGVVLVALDNPFTDPVAEGQLQGEAPPPQGTPEGLPFVNHHHNLAVAGVHQIQNASLKDMAEDKVWTSCTMVLPLRVKGGAGSAVRPVAIGVPNQGT